MNYNFFQLVKPKCTAHTYKEQFRRWARFSRVCRPLQFIGKLRSGREGERRCNLKCNNMVSLFLLRNVPILYAKLSRKHFGVKALTTFFKEKTRTTDCSCYWELWRQILSEHIRKESDFFKSWQSLHLSIHRVPAAGDKLFQKHLR